MSSERRTLTGVSSQPRKKPLWRLGGSSAWEFVQQADLLQALVHLDDGVDGATRALPVRLLAAEGQDRADGRPRLPPFLPAIVPISTQ